jgi:hypothetical protein
MRKPLFAVLLALPSLALAETDTAYKALRVFGKQQGDAVLNRVVELRGRNGAPQPQVWKVVAADPAARGGVQEADIQRGKVIGQRTPTGRPGGPGAPMDLNRLNLDSDGAFTVADQELQKQAIPFDRVDYTLRSAGPGQPPVWALDLFDRGSKVAIMHIAADTGTVIDTQRLIPSGPTKSDYRSDHDYVENHPDARHGGDAHWSQPGQPFRGVDDFFHRLGKRFERRGQQLKNFFNGDH